MDNSAEQSTSVTITSQPAKVYSAIEYSSNAVFITDTKGRVEYANQKFLKLNGWTEEQVMGRSVSEIPHSKNIAVKILQAIKQESHWSMRHQISSPLAIEYESNLVWVRTTIDPIKESSETISGYIGVQSIIHEEVRKELQTKKDIGDLLSLSIRQEKILETLKESRDEALEQVEAKSEFLASMSHDIRTPMTGVLGMTELLQNTKLSNKQTRLTNLIHQSGENLLDLINDILDLSKIEAGKLELNNEFHDIRLLIEEVASTFSELASSKGLELICIYPANDHSLFLCDKQRLIQILSNLIGNAIKFTDKGEIIISVSIDQKNGPVRFEVTDTGPGIPEEDQKSIFETFSQSKTTSRHASKGTGLGLTICKHYCNLMGGDIGVDSIPGAGATFWFTAALEMKKGGSSQLQATDKTTLDGVKVLILDSNESSSNNIADQLKTWGIEVVISGNAKDAVKLLESAQEDTEPFSLAMLDHDMPDISGANLTRVMKNNKILVNTPLILMNSISDLEETMVWTSAGIKSYLTKPVRQSDLYNSLLATLSIPIRKETSVERNESSELYRATFDANILVAEDNPVNQELVELILEKCGCNVTVVSNGKKVVTVLEERKEAFDLILMDCQMPEMDGYVTTKFIRQEMPDKKDLPIIALTANAMDGDQKACFDAGMNDYLAKPFSKNQLIEIMQKWLPQENSTDSHGQINTQRKKVTAEKIKSEIKQQSKTPLPDSGLVLDAEVLELTEPDPKDQEIPDLEISIPKKIEIQSTEESLVAKVDEQEVTTNLNQNTLNNIKALQREGAPDILKKIVGLYFENSKKIVDEIEKAVNEKDAKKIRSAAHSLKSSSANLGAEDLANLCKEMELSGKENQLDSIDKMLIELKQNYVSTCRALELEIS
ncbi:MAG: response regulator [Gammaproteobacteria bacterium]